jgi:hypothetical protein
MAIEMMAAIMAMFMMMMIHCCMAVDARSIVMSKLMRCFRYLVITNANAKRGSASDTNTSNSGLEEPEQLQCHLLLRQQEENLALKQATMEAADVAQSPPPTHLQTRLELEAHSVKLTEMRLTYKCGSNLRTNNARVLQV